MFSEATTAVDQLQELATTRPEDNAKPAGSKYLQTTKLGPSLMFASQKVRDGQDTESQPSHPQSQSS